MTREITHEANSLLLYINNTGSLYPSKKQVLRRLVEAKREGGYTRAGALAMFKPWIRTGRASWRGEFNTPEPRGKGITREIAIKLVESFEAEYRLSNMEWLIQGEQCE